MRADQESRARHEPGAGHEPGTRHEPGAGHEARAGHDVGRGFRADLAYEKHPRAAIRPEEFGGLAYHYDSRRLVLLKSPALVDVVESLGSFPSAADALAARVPAGQARACAAALPGLLTAGVIRLRDRTTDPGPVTEKRSSCPPR